jgi:hypothetical protein
VDVGATQRLEQLDARHARHIDVAHDRIEAAPADLDEGVVARADRGDGVVGHEHSFVGATDEGVVLDDQDAAVGHVRLLGGHPVVDDLHSARTDARRGILRATRRKAPFGSA